MKVKIKIPMLPNFVKDENGNSYNVGQLHPEEIKSLCKDWAKAMVEHAEKRRKKLLSDMNAMDGGER